MSVKKKINLYEIFLTYFKHVYQLENRKLCFPEIFIKYRCNQNRSSTNNLINLKDSELPFKNDLPQISTYEGNYVTFLMYLLSKKWKECSCSSRFCFVLFLFFYTGLLELRFSIKKIWTPMC